ncbi:hypothetical protein M4R22_08020 [Acidovorax sp. GBBC 3334]|uniref:hypothetical protein n=1 Tax=Acidovorax sp. GBBC 3334 TaxID=2940496 RepID=UPI0023033222|nr:hypothetical protein [Acidovorax sp. GBBC 3334]MDA8454706.1 hypothetical protein [Acidovorax sp. GBBC 3334]
MTLKIEARTLTINAVFTSITEMIQNFEQAGWNSSILSNLERYELKGLEYSSINMDMYESVNSACRWIRGMSPHKEGFVLYGNDTWQPNTRISNHKKFWGLFDLKHKPTNEFSWSEQSEDGVKFYGLSPLKENEWLLRSSILERENTWIVLGEFCTELIEKYLSLGWSCSPGEIIPTNLLAFTKETNTFLLRFFGPANDLKQGTIIIGKASSIDELSIYIKASQRV